MPNEKAQEVLAEEILEDARKRAARALARSKAEAAKIKTDAEAEAKAEAEKIRAEAEQRAKRRAEMIVRTVEQEVARRKLRAREAVVQQVMDEAKKQLDALSGDEYRRSVVRLAVAAMRAMPCEEFHALVSARSEDKIEPAQLVAEMEKALQGQGRKVFIEVDLRADLAKGAVVKSADGRLQWDNTFDSRLKRLRSGLRRRIVPGLFGET
jgi:vacuolar-type H+-ATPase subunit E/Vma4